MASTQAQDAIYYHADQINVDHTPSGADVVAGQIVQLGSNLSGVANSAIPDGRKGAIDIAGIYKVAKDAIDTFSAGDLVSWDDTNSQAEPDGGGDEDWKLGVAIKAAIAADNNVIVKFNPNGL